MISADFFKNIWDVFLLFTIPIGGGIPAGVVLGDSRGLSWGLLCVLYFFSDVALACVFDPLLKVFIKLGKKNVKVAKFNELMKMSVLQTIGRIGIQPSPFVLTLIAFGVDPMTGRAATMLAGHGFLTGWAIAITGDMFFFMVVMASTLWLNNILGDGTMTAVIITLAMIFLPTLIKKVFKQIKKTLHF